MRTFPVINHARTRGLLHKLRFRMLSLGEELELAQERLAAEPAGADPVDAALNAARVRDLEARLLEEREEKGAILAEKQALQARARARSSSSFRCLLARSPQRPRFTSPTPLAINSEPTTPKNL